jgi:acyl-CoA thioester hydrolase
MIPRLDPARSRSRSSLRVRFCDTDLMGIVHHATYLAYFEMGRVEWLRRRSVTYSDWTARDIHLPVVEASVRYRAPARFDDLLVVDTLLVELRAASLRFDYRLERDGVLLAEGSTRLACIGPGHALRRLPSDVVEVMASAERAPSPASAPSEACDPQVGR